MDLARSLIQRVNVGDSRVNLGSRTDVVGDVLEHSEEHKSHYEG